MKPKECSAARPAKDRKKTQTLSAQLQHLPKEELVELVLLLVNTDGIKQAKLVVLEKLEQSLGQTSDLQPVHLEKYETLWSQAAGLLDELNEYGGGDEDAEYEVCELLEEINELFMEEKLPAEAKSGYIDRLFQYYDEDNSGMGDTLMDSVFAVAETEDDWRHVVEKLNAVPKAADEASNHYRKELVMQIYRERLGDEEAYLCERLANLEYGMDYFDLATFYHRKGRTEKAVEVAEEGLVKGKGRIVDLITFLKTYYRERDDYENALRLHWLAFADSPGLTTYRELKSFARKDDWPVLERQCLKHLTDQKREKELARINLHEKRYDLVLEYVCADSGPFVEKDDLAQAISARYPEQIISYYKTKMDHLLGEKTRKAYREAVLYARKVRKLHDQLGRPEEFQRYMAQLRSVNANRPALLEEFGRL